MYRMDPHQIKEITDYVFLEDPLAKADMIFIPGCARPEHTEEAARLYREGWAPLLLPSGGFTKLEGGFRGVKKGGDRYGQDFSCEADFLEAVLVANGVPAEAILKEREATYTLENAEKSRKLLLSAARDFSHIRNMEAADKKAQEKRIKAGIPSRAIICCKAHHARRCYMYYSMVFPETELIMHPVTVDGIGPDSWYKTEQGRSMVLGEFSRIGSQLLMMEGRISWD